MLHFYDFEVFKYDWLVVIINPVDNEKTVIVNDKDKLRAYYETHKNDIWVGYNSTHYDQFILKGLLLDFNPYDITTHIIEKDLPGWRYSNAFHTIKLYNYDCVQKFAGLKTLEAFMGNDIKETTVPFNIDRKLTIDEINETIKYCTHDVEQTIEVFLRTKRDFDAHIQLINAFKLPMDYINKTQSQVVAAILKAKKRKYDDEFDISIPDTLKLNKYAYIRDWYLNETNRSYDKTLEVDVAGIPHIFAWGGIHGAEAKCISICNEDEILVMADVTSLYPSLMIQYNYHSRSINDPKDYIDIYDTNVRMKYEGNPLRIPYKLACNRTYGCMKDKNNPLYDPLMANNVCVAGQLLILDLIEKLEYGLDFMQYIQSNTDGIFLKLKRKEFDKFDDIVYEWEQRTRLSMEFSYYTKCYQKDVNNYVLVDTKGKAKTKGAYVKKQNDLDYDLPIINQALNDYMVKDIPIETTINNCNELIMFQKIVKLTNKYDFVEHNNIRYDYKSYRVFASKSKEDGQILKCKYLDDRTKKDKFGNTPDKCFINNDNIKDARVPASLDRKWYIDLAKERLRQFGVL